MKVYILKSEYNYYGDTQVNEIIGVYDNKLKAQKSMLEDYLSSRRESAYEFQDLMNSAQEKLDINLGNIIQMENMHYDDPGFSFPVDIIHLHNVTEDYTYYWIEEHEVL